MSQRYVKKVTIIIVKGLRKDIRERISWKE